MGELRGKSAPRVLWEQQPGRVIGNATRPMRRRWWRARRELNRVTPRVWLALLWEPRDLWVGIYWTRPDVNWRHAVDVYICVVPCLPLLIKWRRSARLFGVWGFKAAEREPEPVG